MARFRCCNNHTTVGHALDCHLRPPDHKTDEEREDREGGCKFDLLHFEHIGECKGTCGEDEEAAQFYDEETEEIVVVMFDPNDPDSERRLAELEAEGHLTRLSIEELADLARRAAEGEDIKVKTMKLEDFEREVRERNREENPYLTIVQCAGILGFSRSWTRELCRRGKFEGAKKLLGKWAIPQSAVLIDD